MKLSFIHFYRRIFCTGVGNVFRTITTVIIALIILWGVAFEFAFLFICKGHFSAWWDSIKSLNTYCHPELKLEVGFASTDFITDVLVLALPIPMVQHAPRYKHLTHLTEFAGMETAHVCQS